VTKGPRLPRDAGKARADKLTGPVSAKSRLGQMVYWSAVGVGVIALAAGSLAAYRGREIEPLLVTATFAFGAWLVGRAARDVAMHCCRRLRHAQQGEPGSMVGF